MYWVLAAAMTAALLVLAACAKRPAPSEEEDGGVRHYVDTDAPKTVDSTDLTYFYCKFSTRDIPLQDSPVAGYVITLRAAEDGGSYSLRRGSESECGETFTPDAAFFDALQELVSRYDFAQHNGQHYKVSGLPPDFGIRLEIRYASGETVCASNNQDCFLSKNAMEELVALFQQTNAGGA